MLNPSLRIILIIGIIIYFATLFSFLRKRRFMLKYALLWIVLGFCLLLLTIFPGILYFIAHVIGIAAPTNALFFVMIIMVILILLSITAICSGFSDKTRELIQQIAILEKKVRELEMSEKEKTEPSKSHQHSRE